MVHRLRLALAAIWAATLVLVAAVAVIVGGGMGGAGASAAAASSRSAGLRPVVVQPAPLDAAANRSADAEFSAASDATAPTTAAPAAAAAPAPTTVAPTTAPPIVASTVPPAPAHVATTAPRPVPTTVARPATTTPPKVTPAGSSGTANDFSLIGYRWNPCQTITVTSAGPAVAGIVSELASITGLHLQMVSGPVAQITVIWGAVPAGGEIGLTAWRAVGSWLTTAGIVISQDAQPYLATVLRHELAHALGLGHAARSNEIMYPIAGGSSPTDYQAGDLAGLRAIGTAAGGC
jgi:hypothetical protein